MNPTAEGSGNLLKGHLDLILLAILERDSLYGLEIIKEAQSRTEGYFEFREGSLYPALHRLTEAGHLRAEFRYSPRGGARVRYYAITEAGRQELQRKRAEFQRFTGAVTALWEGTP